MKTDNVKVIVRLRPLARSEQPDCVITKHSAKTVEVNRGLSNYTVRFTHVLSPEETQQHTFLTVQPSLDSFLQGKNATILAYGQTGAGKTHTILGKDSRNWDFSGIIPRSIRYIFTQLPSEADLYCSLYEIYNDKIFDLLEMKKHSPLAMKDDAFGHSFIPDLLTIPVYNETSVFNYLNLGLKHRKVRATEMNLESSRSHCVFQLLHVQKNQTFRLRIVDLAGSEKFHITKQTKLEEKTARMAELSSINKSLTALGQCVFALSQKKRGHIPYRDSKLTRVLRDSLEGNSDVIVIACMSPSLSCFNESLSTLRFAERAKRAIVEEKISEKVLDVIEKERMERKEMALKLKEYEAEIERLKDQNQKLHNQLQKSRKVRWLSDINPHQINYDLHNELYRDDRIFDHVTFFNQNESIEEVKPIDIESPARKDESMSTSFISFTDPNLSWTSEAQQEPKNTLTRKFQSSFDIAMGSFKELINDMDTMKKYPRTPMK